MDVPADGEPRPNPPQRSSESLAAPQSLLAGRVAVPSWGRVRHHDIRVCGDAVPDPGEPRVAGICRRVVAKGPMAAARRVRRSKHFEAGVRSRRRAQLDGRGLVLEVRYRRRRREELDAVPWGRTVLVVEAGAVLRVKVGAERDVVVSRDDDFGFKVRCF